MVFIRKKNSLLKPPLQNYNGSLKCEKFISFKNHMNLFLLKTIWIWITSGLTLCYQQIGHTNLKNCHCKIRLKILTFSFISKKIFYLMVLGLYAHDLCKNAKNRIVISFLSQTLCETAVLRSLICHNISQHDNENFINVWFSYNAMLQKVLSVTCQTSQNIIRIMNMPVTFYSL